MPRGKVNLCSTLVCWVQLPCPCKSAFLFSWAWEVFLGTAAPERRGLRRPLPPSCLTPSLWTFVHRLPPGRQGQTGVTAHGWHQRALCARRCQITSMTKHFSWDPPVSADNSYLRLRLFSFNSMTGFFPFLVKIGPWVPCLKQTNSSEKNHLVHFIKWTKYFEKITGEAEIQHTSSDVLEALVASWPSSVLGSDLVSEPVGRPRSCRTYDIEISKPV